MGNDDLRIEAEWHESYELGVWTGVPNLRAEKAYKEFRAYYEGRLEAVLATSEHQIYKRISQDLGRGTDFPDNRLLSLVKRGIYDVSTRFSRKVEQLTWGDAVGSSELLLLSTLIRGAKESDDHRISLTDVEWGDLSFDRKGINPEGRIDENWLEKVWGVKDEVQQKKILGYCALKMIESGAFSEPQRLAFRGEVATIQVAQA